jgi:hypothetical protein
VATDRPQTGVGGDQRLVADEGGHHDNEHGGERGEVSGRAVGGPASLAA